MGTSWAAYCLQGLLLSVACPPVPRKLEKHGREIVRMASAEHRELVPLVEVSLAIMRLACEKFFVLISVLATYLLFRDEAPRPARLLIRLNHRLSVLFQRVRDKLHSM